MRTATRACSAPAASAGRTSFARRSSSAWRRSWRQDSTLSSSASSPRPTRTRRRRGRVAEEDWRGAVTLEATPEERLQPGLLTSGIDGNPGGLAGVWAVENSRDAIFEAMERREVFGTSGPRIRPRFFGGWGYSENLCDQADLFEQAYAGGVPMGGDLTEASAGAAPTFLAFAARDPADGAGLLQQLQLVKGWVDADGTGRTQVIPIAGSPDNGASVDPATGERSGEGHDTLCTGLPRRGVRCRPARLLLSAGGREPQPALELVRLPAPRPGRPSRRLLGRLLPRDDPGDGLDVADLVPAGVGDGVAPRVLPRRRSAHRLGRTPTATSPSVGQELTLGESLGGARSGTRARHRPRADAGRLHRARSRRVRQGPVLGGLPDRARLRGRLDADRRVHFAPPVPRPAAGTRPRPRERASPHHDGHWRDTDRRSPRRPGLASPCRRERTRRFYETVPVASALDEDALWPMGDRLPDEPLPDDIDAEKLAAAVEAAFRPGRDDPRLRRAAPRPAHRRALPRGASTRTRRSRAGR